MMFDFLPDITFPEWFTESQTLVLQYWINAMIQTEPDNRPTAEKLGEKLGELFTALVSAMGETETRPYSSDHHTSFIQPCNVLGVVSLPWLHGELRWETVVNPGSFVQHEKTLKRYERFVAARTTLLGREFPCTLAMMSIWAWTAFYLGLEVETAVEVFLEIAEITKTRLGVEHAQTLAAMSGAAWSYIGIRQDTQAKTIFEDIVAVQTKTLGDRHPETLSSKFGLATALCNAGETERSASLFEDTIQAQTQEKKLGRNHPATLLSMAGLAWAYIKLDRKEPNGVLLDRKRALALYEETATKQAEVLRDDHLETMSSSSGRAWALCLTGEPERAVAIFKEVIARQKRVLGPNHSETLYSIKGLCESYDRMGQNKRAFKLRRDLEESV